MKINLRPLVKMARYGYGIYGRVNRPEGYWSRLSKVAWNDLRWGNGLVALMLIRNGW